MLKIKDLTVKVEWKEILKKINLNLEIGKNYCILWPNWSWKSSLALTIMGHPKYNVKCWMLNVKYNNKTIDLTKLNPSERSKLWIFLAFQHIPEVKWVKLFEFLKSIYDNKHWTKTSFLQFKKIIEPLLAELKIDKEFLRRDLNVGFSGGERRKTELLQIRLLEPTYIFLDEVDSGLDVDAFRDIAKQLKKLNHGRNSFIIITHLFKILDHLPVDMVYVMKNWEIIKFWDKKLINKISKEGFGKIS